MDAAGLERRSVRIDRNSNRPPSKARHPLPLGLSDAGMIESALLQSKPAHPWQVIEIPAETDTDARCLL
jgi:hypothetical protein